jgi:hypothetical protein
MYDEDNDIHPEGLLCSMAASGASAIQSGADTPQAKAALGQTHAFESS